MSGIGQPWQTKMQHLTNMANQIVVISTKLIQDSLKLSKRHHNLFSGGLSSTIIDGDKRSPAEIFVFVLFIVMYVQGLVNPDTQLDINMHGTVNVQLGSPPNIHRPLLSLTFPP